MNQRFLVRIEQQGRVTYRTVQGQRQALAAAVAYAAQSRSGRTVVLDAAGRIIWNALSRTRG